MTYSEDAAAFDAKSSFQETKVAFAPVVCVWQEK